MGLDKVRFVSWNARALDHHDKAIRRLKIRELEDMCLRFDIIGVLEAHGSAISLEHILAKCLQTHRLISSHFVDGSGETILDKGVVLLLVSKLFDDANCPNNYNFSHVVEGRALLCEIQRYQGDNSGMPLHLSFLLVHNHGFTYHDVMEIKKVVDRETQSVKDNLKCRSFVLAGDFNQEKDANDRFSVLSPGGVPKREGLASGDRHLSRHWNNMFENLVEIEFPSPSQFISESNSFSKINRFFVFGARSIISFVKWQAGVLGQEAE